MATARSVKSSLSALADQYRFGREAVAMERGAFGDNRPVARGENDRLSTNRPTVWAFLAASLAVWALAAVTDFYWLSLLVVPLVFAGARWGYGDPAERALSRAAIAAAAVVAIGLLW